MHTLDCESKHNLLKFVLERLWRHTVRSYDPMKLFTLLHHIIWCFIFGVRIFFPFVTLDHKTSRKGQFL